MLTGLVAFLAVRVVSVKQDNEMLLQEKEVLAQENVGLTNDVENLTVKNENLASKNKTLNNTISDLNDDVEKMTKKYNTFFRGTIWVTEGTVTSVQSNMVAIKVKGYRETAIYMPRDGYYTNLRTGELVMVFQYKYNSNYEYIVWTSDFLSNPNIEN